MRNPAEKSKRSPKLEQKIKKVMNSEDGFLVLILAYRTHNISRHSFGKGARSTFGVGFRRQTTRVRWKAEKR